MPSVITKFFKNFLEDQHSAILYEVCRRYSLVRSDVLKWGIPFVENGLLSSKQLPLFSKSADHNKQFCRCGLKVSPLQKDWFQCLNGCHYHPGKKLKKFYSCCSKSDSSTGCAKARTHVCFYRPLSSSEFISTSTIKTSGLKYDDLLNSIKSLKTHKNIFALDCEMGFTEGGYEILRVSVISFDGQTIFDTLVKPNHRILDCNTKYSGITEEMLEGVIITLKDVQQYLISIFNSETIVVGHAIGEDFLSLNFVHGLVIDTSILFQHEKGYPYRTSLKNLAKKHLNKTIQNSAEGHDSVEDATTCIELLLYKIMKDLGDEIFPDHKIGKENSYSLLTNPSPINVPKPETVPATINYSLLTHQSPEYVPRPETNPTRVSDSLSTNKSSESVSKPETLPATLNKFLQEQQDYFNEELHGTMNASNECQRTTAFAPAMVHTRKGRLLISNPPRYSCQPYVNRAITISPFPKNFWYYNGIHSMTSYDYNNCVYPQFYYSYS